MFLVLAILLAALPAPRELAARVARPIRLLDEKIGVGTVTSAQTRQRLVAAAATARAQGRQSVHALIQLDGVPGRDQRRILRRAGVDLQHYVPDDAWIAALPANDPLAIVSYPPVRWIGLWEGDRKVHPRVRARQWSPWALHPRDDKVMLFVQLHADVPLERGRLLAGQHRGVAMEPVVGLHGLTVWMSEAGIDRLTQEEEILWVEEGPPPLQPTNDGVRDSMQVDVIQISPLDGSGVRLFVFDAGLVRATHQNFDAAPGRVTTFGGSTQDSHATHVAGTAAGDGGSGSNARARGVAPAAKLLSAQYSQVGGTLFWDHAGDIEADYATARKVYGADLGTNSLGSNVATNGYNCSLEGDYGVASSLLDGIVRGDNAAVGSAVIMTWAAGNERSGGSPPGRCGSSYRTTAPPSCAKNPIHVGATNSDHDSMTSFSSWGPCDDGRLKPVVTAPGCQLGRSPGPPTQESTVFSSTATNNTSYGGACGTSMATPAVAGVVALMLQEWRARGFGGAFERPLPALVKALLVHTARDLGQDGPDFVYGFGEVDAQAAVQLVRNGSPLGGTGTVAWGVDSVVSSASDSFTVSVAAGTAELKATLVWDDPAAAAFAAAALINNLDLQLIAPDSTVYRPWILDPAVPHLPATTGTNHLDNQEQVLIRDPLPGTWTIEVAGTSVPQSPQSYGLVYSTRPTTYDSHSCAEAVVNGGFEAGSNSWVLSGASVVAAPAPGHGSSSLRLGNVNGATHTAYQEIAVPSGVARAELSYFWYMTTNEGSSGHPWDFYYAEIRDPSNQVLATKDYRSDGWPANQWMKTEKIDLAPWAGEAIRLVFFATTDRVLTTTFYVDDVSIQLCSPPPPSSPTLSTTPTVTHTPTPSLTPTATSTATRTSTHTPTPNPTTTPTVSPSLTATHTATGTPTAPATPSASASASLTPTPTPSPTGSPSHTPSNTPLFTPTATPTPENTATPTILPTSTSSVTPTLTRSPTPTPSTTPTVIPSPSPTPTVVPTATPTPFPSATPSGTATDTPTPNPSPTPTRTASPTGTPTPTLTASPTPSAPPSPTASPTATSTPSASATFTLTSSPRPTETPTPTPTATLTISPSTTVTSSATPSPTRTATTSPTTSPTATDTATEGPSVTPTPAPSASPTHSPTLLSTSTPSGPAAVHLSNAGRGAFGLSPGRVCITATLSTNGQPVAAAGNDITFDASIFTFESCFMNQALAAFGKSLSRASLGPGSERVSVSGGTAVLPDGVIYTCTLTVAASTPDAAYTFGNQPSALDAASVPLPVVGSTGAATIISCAADCDGSGQVGIGEVSRAGGLFLGEPLCNPSNPNLSCPPADMIDNNGLVSIGEVSRSGCLFLNGTCSKTCS